MRTFPGAAPAAARPLASRAGAAMVTGRPPTVDGWFTAAFAAPVAPFAAPVAPVTSYTADPLTGQTGAVGAGGPAGAGGRAGGGPPPAGRRRSVPAGSGLRPRWTLVSGAGGSAKPSVGRR